jgi:putative ABC transport system permease protein
MPYAGYFDTSLLEAAWFLVQVLFVISIVALVAGLLTLPLFYLVLGTVRAWFWGMDERGGHTPVRRAAAFAARWLVPAASFAATYFFAGYFGLFDIFSSGPPDVKLAFRARYDHTTRSLAEKMAGPAPVLTEVTATDPIAMAEQIKGNEQAKQDWDQRVKRPLGMIRMLSTLFLIILGPFPTLVVLLCLLVGRKGVILIFRSLTRNLLRTSLTYLAVFVLAFVVSAIWAALGFLDDVTTEKESNLKAIITERYQIPSMMPPAHLSTLKALIEELPREMRPKNGDDDIMTWAFVGGTTDPEKRTFENTVFFFATEPRKLLTMMDGLDELTGEQQQLLKAASEKMEQKVNAVILGKERLRQMNKRVGERIQVTSINYQGMTYDLEIIGEFPEGRYDLSAVMNKQYLYDGMEEYRRANGKEHPNADKCMNLIWVRMPDKRAFEVLADKVNSSGKFSPPVKMETASSAIGTFLDSFKDVLFFMRVLLAPALLATMVLVISNAITISVRERRTEMAVLKVLGFRPWMVMGLVLGESALLGALSGFMATATAYTMVNSAGGLPFPIAFFPKFLVPAAALWWGPAVGGGAALLGSLIPALSARSVKVSEVFAKVA